jgi:hypothetical protein
VIAQHFPVTHFKTAYGIKWSVSNSDSDRISFKVDGARYSESKKQRYKAINHARTLARFGGLHGRAEGILQQKGLPCFTVTQLQLLFARRREDGFEVPCAPEHSPTRVLC